jgi:hypothetical protein
MVRMMVSGDHDMAIPSIFGRSYYDGEPPEEIEEEFAGREIDALEELEAIYAEGDRQYDEREEERLFPPVTFAEAYHQAHPGEHLPLLSLAEAERLEHKPVETARQLGLFGTEVA